MFFANSWIVPLPQTNPKCDTSSICPSRDLKLANPLQTSAIHAPAKPPRASPLIKTSTPPTTTTTTSAVHSSAPPTTSPLQTPLPTRTDFQFPLPLDIQLPSPQKLPFDDFPTYPKRYLEDDFVYQNHILLEEHRKAEATEYVRRKLYLLLSAGGALERGVRACLKALYIRGIFPYRAAKNGGGLNGKVYLEFCPAYAIVVSVGNVTRYAVEQRAWPVLCEVFKWEEISTKEALRRGIELRKRKRYSWRYGRHLLVDVDKLGAALEVAQSLFGGDEDLGRGGDEGKVEAILRLEKVPKPGRSVAARCPRSQMHSHGDRKPSLILWMNEDGRSGGALCPVCYDSGVRSSAGKGAGGNGHHVGHLTWRARYHGRNEVTLFTPCSRVSVKAKPGLKLVNNQLKKSIVKKEALTERSTRVTKVKGCPFVADAPVGGCVVTKKTVGKIGATAHSGYVKATLRAVSPVDDMSENEKSESSARSRTRTIGKTAKQKCPIEILTAADHRSTWQAEVKKAESLSWFARESVNPETDDDDVMLDSVKDDHSLDVTDWYPTNVLSVSAMRVSSWRDVVGENGRHFRAPASWEATYQQWVVFDFDELQCLDGDTVPIITKALIRLVRRNVELSGRCVVVQTGPCGIHVWAELREARFRPYEWFVKEVTRKWYREFGDKLLKAARRCGAKGGKVDMSSCSAGRFARQPGWRILKDGSCFRSRVVDTAATRVKGRTPRYAGFVNGHAEVKSEQKAISLAN